MPQLSTAGLCCRANPIALGNIEISHLQVGAPCSSHNLGEHSGDRFLELYGRGGSFAAEGSGLSLRQHPNLVRSKGSA